ncbi:hypothetical protein RIVM261_055220 [Rivularia sp. IAM M-261]|nr:hypothetical protein RIVM261_055220 [Rivularia sp. IAM M-261]
MSLLNQKSQKINISILPIFAVASFGLNIIILLLLIFHGSMLQRLNGARPQSLVQLADGRGIVVDTKPNLERHQETIRRFIGEATTLMFTWSEKQSQETVWQITSQLLSGDIRQKVSTEISQSLARNNFNNSIRDAEGLLVIKHLSLPEQIGEGKWKVRIIANRLFLTGYDKIGEPIPFNKQILVRAIDTQTIASSEAPTPLHSAVYKLGETRLQIYNICDIEDKSCL